MATSNVGKRDTTHYKIFRLYGDDEITDDQILDFIQKHQTRVSARYQKLWNAYRGDYPVFDTAYNPPKEDWQEDHRVAVNFAELGTSTFVGFNFGNPIKVNYTNRDVDEATSQEVNAAISRIRAANSMRSLDAKTGTSAFVFGIGQRLLYLEDNEVRVVNVSKMDGFPIYDDGLVPRIRYFIRIYEDDDRVMHGTISDDTTVRSFHIKSKIEWEEEHPHGFPGVPVVIYDLTPRADDNYEPMGGFENALSAMDDYNHTMSAKWNDIAAFSNAILKIKGPKVTMEMARMIRDMRVLNLTGKDSDKSDGSFMERPDGDGIQEHNLDRLEDDIFRVMRVTDVTDDSFATTSGIALQFKMTPMVNLAEDNWTCFEEADRHMWRLICGNLATDFDPEDWRYLVYDHTLNFPTDLSSEAATARNLDGIVSRKTQLSSLSLVKDVDDELAQIELEASRDITPAVQDVNMPGVATTANDADQPTDEEAEDGRA